ncbi:translation initiation factor IF-2 [Elusimicrobiota bacterium]
MEIKKKKKTLKNKSESGEDRQRVDGKASIVKKTEKPKKPRAPKKTASVKPKPKEKAEKPAKAAIMKEPAKKRVGRKPRVQKEISKEKGSEKAGLDAAQAEQAARLRGILQKAELPKMIERASLQAKSAPELPVEKEVKPPVVEPAPKESYKPQAPRPPSKPEPVKPPPPPKKKLSITPHLTVKEFSQMLGIGIPELIKKLMGLGVWATINQRLDADVAGVVASEYGFVVSVSRGFDEDKLISAQSEDENASALERRAPIVTVMGHVDHGKTTLLDVIRKTRVAESEVGGITQHIGAYRVIRPEGSITFLDTPGHEAFSAMRARGAKVTDIVVLVVAADSAVMPQTVEAIDHAKAAGVPIIVAINKVDLPTADVSKIRRELSKYNLVSEDWGGKTSIVEVSAKRRLNLDKLFEIIFLETEMLELKANPKRKAVGFVVEAKKDPRKGNVVTVLVQEGTLKVGDAFICGLASGKVRALIDEHGTRQISIGPSHAAQVLGFDALCEAGDKFIAVNDERQARELSSRRKLEAEVIHGKMRSKHLTLEDLHSKIESGEVKELRMIIRADTSGSLEAIVSELSALHHKEVVIKVLHSNLGTITPSDVLLAAASDAIILGFHVETDPRAEEEAKRQDVEITLYKVIYEMIDNIRSALEGMLAPIIRENVLGSAEVKQAFTIKGIGSVAGCLVKDGKIVKGGVVKVRRDGKDIFEGKVSTLKRFKDDVNEVTAGFECGLNVNGFNNVRKGDLIVYFTQVKELKRLSKT